MTSALGTSTSAELDQIRAVCLDIDDTLLDNTVSSRLGLVALVGNDAGWPVWQRATHECYEHFVAGKLTFDAMRTERTRAFFAAFGEDISRAEATRRESRRLAAMRHVWRLFDDAVPCLERLRAYGLHIAVITNAPSSYQREKITSIGLGHAFDAIVISEECGVAKPDRRIFETACAALHARPHEVVHVGDRLDTDAAGASRAGMHGIWLNRWGRPDTPPENVRTITQLADLPDLLARWITPDRSGHRDAARSDAASTEMTSTDVAHRRHPDNAAEVPSPRAGGDRRPSLGMG